MTQQITYGGAPKQRRTLMQIVDELRTLIDLNEGEVTDDVELVEMALAEKVEAYRYIMRELEAEATMLDSLADAYGSRANIRREKIEALKTRLADGLTKAGVDKMQTPTCTAYFQSSKSVVIADEKAFVETAEDRFVKVEQKPRKDELKKALEAGEVVEGAELRTSRHLRFR